MGMGMGMGILGMGNMGMGMGMGNLGMDNRTWAILLGMGTDRGWGRGRGGRRKERG